MLFITGVFFCLLLQVMGQSICGPAKSCTGGSQCMITLTVNFSSTVTHCSEVVNTECVLFRRGEIVLSTSGYYDTITSWLTTSRTASYKFTELKEDIDSLYCYLYEERHTKVKREVEKQSGSISDKERRTKYNLPFLITLGILVVVIFATSCIAALLYSKGFLHFQKRVVIPYSSNPLFYYLKNDISLSFRLTLPNKQPVSITDEKLARALVSQSQSRFAVFESRSGSGKTCFFQKTLRKWENGEVMKKCHLIYFQIDCTKMELSLEDLVDKVRFYMRNVKTPIHHGRVILILDGLSILQLCEKSMSTLEELNNEHFFNDEMQFWIGVSECKGKDTTTVYENIPKVCVEACKKDQFKSMFDDRKCGRSIPDEILKRDDLSVMLTLPLVSRLLALIYLHESKLETSNEQIEIVSRFCSEENFNKNEDLESLINYGAWDLLACLLEAFVKKEGEYTGYVKMLHGMKLKFEHIDEDYPRQAILHLLYKMKKEERQPSSIEFVSRKPTFVKGYLPKVEERLIFSNSCLKSESFHSFIKTALKSCEKIQFCHSELPKKVKKISGLLEDAEVTHMRSNVEYTLDFQTGKWKKRDRNLF